MASAVASAATRVRLGAVEVALDREALRES